MKLIALDLDGTLLNSDKVVSERNAAALSLAAAQGNVIAPATGRALRAIPEQVMAFPFVHYAITINGAKVSDTRTGQALLRAEIALDTCLRLLDFVGRYDAMYDCYWNDTGWVDQSFLERVRYYNSDEAALHNPNMIVHTVGAVMSIPRIEATHGDFCMYHEAFTPSTWNLLEALDGEKMRVLEHLGCDPVPYVEACKFRNSLDDARDAKEVFFAYAAMPERAKGPLTVRSRYITEDVPQGLGLLESLGAALGVPTPVCSSLIEIASAALGCDLRAQGRTIERLGRDNIRAILDDAERGAEPCPAGTH